MPPFYGNKTSIWLAFWHNNFRLLRHNHRDFVCWLSHSDAFAFFSISTLDISLINTTTFRHSDLLTSFANLITCVRIRSTTTSFSNRYFGIVISTSVVCLETAIEAPHNNIRLLRHSQFRHHNFRYVYWNPKHYNFFYCYSNRHFDRQFRNNDIFSCFRTTTSIRLKSLSQYQLSLLVPRNIFLPSIWRRSFKCLVKYSK